MPNTILGLEIVIALNMTDKVPTFSDLIFQLRDTGNKHITKQ